MNALYERRKEEYVQNIQGGSEYSCVSRKNTPLVDKSCSSSLNGSNLEQMSYNRVGRLPLEVVEIWNKSL